MKMPTNAKALAHFQINFSEVAKGLQELYKNDLNLQDTENFFPESEYKSKSD